MAQAVSEARGNPVQVRDEESLLYPSADHERGMRWQARYTDPNGTPRRSTFDSWEEARNHLEEVRLAIRTHTWVDPEAGKKKVWLYAKEFIEERQVNKKNENTTDTYDSHLRTHIVPFLGHREARTLVRADSKALVSFLRKQPSINSAYYVGQIFATWRILVHYMIDEDVPLPANICKRVDLPEVEKRQDNYTPPEVVTLAEAMRQIEPRYEIIVWLAACAGLRSGEILGLTESAVLWERSKLKIAVQRQRTRAVRLKTRTSYATLPVDRFLLDRLAEHLERFRGPAPVSRRAQEKRRQRGYVPPPDEGLIVTTRQGGPLTRSSFNDKWQEAVALAGLPKGSRLHGLKRFYTTRLMAKGEFAPKTVQALSRHGAFEETVDTYAEPPEVVSGVTVRTFSRLFLPLPDAEPSDGA